MSNEAGEYSAEEALAWAKSRLDEAVQEIIKSGILEGITVEARVAWTLPKKIIIGRIRDSGLQQRELWIIAGDLPTDCINAGTCATPREAARHFALKWQLGAEQIRDPKARKQRSLSKDVDWENASNELASVAEKLYAIVEEDRAWEQPDDG